LIKNRNEIDENDNLPGTSISSWGWTLPLRAEDGFPFLRGGEGFDLEVQIRNPAFFIAWLVTTFMAFTPSLCSAIQLLMIGHGTITVI
jgi:hypothetical protein